MHPIIFFDYECILLFPLDVNSHTEIALVKTYRFKRFLIVQKHDCYNQSCLFKAKQLTLIIKKVIMKIKRS